MGKKISSCDILIPFIILLSYWCWKYNIIEIILHFIHSLRVHVSPWLLNNLSDHIRIVILPFLSLLIAFWSFKLNFWFILIFWCITKSHSYFLSSLWFYMLRLLFQNSLLHTPHYEENFLLKPEEQFHLCLAAFCLLPFIFFRIIPEN